MFDWEELELGDLEYGVYMGCGGRFWLAWNDVRLSER